MKNQQASSRPEIFLNADGRVVAPGSELDQNMWAVTGIW